MGARDYCTRPIWAPRLARGAALVLVALTACAGDGGSLEPATVADDRANGVAATRTAVGLRLVNSGAEALAFTVFERGYAALVLFAPCVDPGPTCVRLPAGQSLVVPFGQIGGYTPGAREAVVYTWRVVPNGAGGYRAEDFTSRVVALQ
jgi:hypothetical protein